MRQTYKKTALADDSTDQRIQLREKNKWNKGTYSSYENRPYSLPLIFHLLWSNPKLIGSQREII